jgi:hypothetical protein
VHLAEYDRIRAVVAERGFTPEIESRIALFMCACKAVNLPYLTLAGIATAATMAWQALNTQLFRESEAMTLLFRVTRWAPDPFVYLEAAQLAAPLYAECARVGFAGWPMSGEGPGLEAMALGHALLATARLTPILPETDAAQTPFAVALLRIEQENGRLLQTQIRLLKDGFGKTSPQDRETAIARKAKLVEAAFTRFLTSLAGPVAAARRNTVSS